MNSSRSSLKKKPTKKPKEDFDAWFERFWENYTFNFWESPKAKEVARDACKELARHRRLFPERKNEASS